MNKCNLTIPKEVAGKTFQFDSVEDIQYWITQEQQAYQWLFQVGRRFSNVVWNHVSTQFQQALAQVDVIKQNIARGQPYDGNIDALRFWFADAYGKNKKLVLTTSSVFKAVIDMKESSSIKAAIFLGHIISVPQLYQNGVEMPEMLEGSFEYFQYIKGISKKDLSAEKQALNELKMEWDQHLTDFKINEEKVKADFEATKINFDNYFRDTQENVSEHLTKHTTDLDELKKTYDQFMALKAPVDYWLQKGNEHTVKVSQFRNWILGIGVLGGSGLLWAVHHVFSNGVINYWKIGCFILLATLFFWAMRILVKLLLSNIHLENDSKERVVMSQTYLALLREQSGFNDNDKKLILTTLFRPSSSGMGIDDGVPPGIFDALTKLMSR